MIPHSRPSLGREEREAIEEVLNSGQIAQGKKAAEFERNFANLVGRRYAVAVSSGTAALELSLRALKIGAGDEVVFPSYTCVSLLHAVEAVGALPVLADIDLEDLNLSVPEAKKKLRKKTKGLIVPHAFGRPARMGEFEKLGVPVIEDGTQALGARITGKKVGSFGALSVFSFYATKMITTGEGGMVVTDSRPIAETLRDLRDYDKKEFHLFRTNSKMTDLEAAMGIEQAKKLPRFIERRRAIARRYREALQKSSAILPAEDAERDHVYYRFVIRVPKEAQHWLNRLQARGVDAKEPVFKAVHESLRESDSRFPASTQAMQECLSLPIYPSLTEEECCAVLEALRAESARPRRDGIRRRPLKVVTA